MKKSVLVTLALSAGLFGTTTISNITAQAHAIPFTAGTPTWSHGYWHTHGHYKLTYQINNKHIWSRISGWNDLGNYRTRFPWHGYDYVKDEKPVSDSELIESFDPQTGHRQWIALYRDNHKGKSIYIAFEENGVIGRYYKLYHGNR